MDAVTKFKIRDLLDSLSSKKITVGEAEDEISALWNEKEQSELLMGFASLIHEKMNFVDAHSPHVYIDDYLARL